LEKSRRVRSAISLNQSMNSLLDDLAKLQDKTKTSVITDTLEASRPALEMLRDALVKAKSGVPKDEILSAMITQGLRGVADSLELDFEGKKPKKLSKL
jgi:hypothetical protein